MRGKRNDAFGVLDFETDPFLYGCGTLGKEQKLMKQGKHDKLTGLHYVIYLPRKHRNERKKK